MVAPNRNDVIFDYAIIEGSCFDNPGVRMKGVWISKGLLYIWAVLLTSTELYASLKRLQTENILINTWGWCSRIGLMLM